jgi:hypothetical protein
LHATGPSFIGTPPPPPVTGFGDGTFSAGIEFGLAASTALCQFGPINTQYDFDYTTDAATEPGLNQLAHIKFDADLSHQITIHQKLNEPPPVVDAEGIIVGPGFSFRIISSEPIEFGLLTPPPGTFEIHVRGVLKTADGSCETDADFNGTLIPGPRPPTPE